MNARIYVVAHKPYRIPQDQLYTPIGVGSAAQSRTYAVTDVTGKSITEKNAHYCELTALYWLWKNAHDDVIGLAHYRRHFAGKRLGLDRWQRVLTSGQLEKAMKDAPVILPKPRHYLIETNWSQYANAHHESDLVKTRECIEKLCPDYLTAFDAVMRRTTGHRFNMFIMQKDLLDRYCEWLFSLLFALEDKLDLTDYSAYDARVYGFIGERLLDVWVEKNGVRYRELPVVYMEKINWLTKGFHFIARKLKGGGKRA